MRFPPSGALCYSPNANVQSPMSNLARQIDRCFAQPRASRLISIYVLRIRSADHKATPYHKDASKNLNAMRASSELTNVPSRPHHDWKAGYINHFLSRQYVGIWPIATQTGIRPSVANGGKADISQRLPNNRDL